MKRAMKWSLAALLTGILVTAGLVFQYPYWLVPYLIPYPAEAQFTSVTSIGSYRSFNEACTDIGSTNATGLMIPVGVTVDTTTTCTSNITLWFIGAGALNISGGVTVTMEGPVIDDSPTTTFLGSGTVTINGPFDAPLRQVFGSSLTVNFGLPQTVELKWWGPAADGTTDDQSIFTAAHDALPTEGGTIHVSGDEYALGSAWTISSHNIHVLGDGQARSTAADHGTRLRFTGATNGVVIQSVSGGRMGIRLERFSIIGANASGTSALKLGTGEASTTGMTSGVIKDIHIEVEASSSWSTGIEFVDAQNNTVENSFVFANVGDGITNLITLDDDSRGNTFSGVSLTGKATSGTERGVYAVDGAGYAWFGGVVQGGFTEAAFDVDGNANQPSVFLYSPHIGLTSGGGKDIRYDDAVGRMVVVGARAGTGGVSVGETGNAWDFTLFGGEVNTITLGANARNPMIWPSTTASGGVTDNGATNPFLGPFRRSGQSDREAMKINGTGLVLGAAGTTVIERRWAAASSVSDGGTIAHGMGSTPTVAFVQATVASEMASVTALDGTNITVAIKKDDGTAGTSQTIYWLAER